MHDAILISALGLCLTACGTSPKSSEATPAGSSHGAEAPIAADGDPTPDAAVPIAQADGTATEGFAAAATAADSDAAAPATVSHDTATPTDAATSAPRDPVDCDPRKIRCRRAMPRCPDFHVPSVVGACYGDCVPLTSCQCSEAADCPAPAIGTCHMKAGHCGPYL